MHFRRSLLLGTSALALNAALTCAAVLAPQKAFACTAVFSDSTFNDSSTDCIHWGAGNVSVTGFGILAGSGTAIFNFATSSPGNLTNNGVISGDTYGIFNPAVLFVGSGSPPPSFPGAMGTITNTGTITGGATGIQNNGSIAGIVNSGTIGGGSWGINNSGSIGPISNGTTGGAVAATITGITNTGNISTITNYAGASIGGGNTGISNSSDIGTISNYGIINGNDNGINNVGANIGTIINNGTISSSFDGIFNYESSIATITNNGTISGGAFRAGINDGNFNSGATISVITNSGLITGGNGITNSGTIGTIINSGTISGTTYGIDNSGFIGGGTDAIDSSIGTIIGALSNSGTIGGNILANQALTITGSLGTLTGGTISTNNHNLLFDSSAYQYLNDNVDTGASNTVTNNGTLLLQATHSITGNYVQGSLASLVIAVSDPSNYGDLVITGAATMTNDRVTIVANGGPLTNGEAFTIGQASTVGTDYTGIVAFANGFLADTTSSIIGSIDELIVTLEACSNQAVGGNTIISVACGLSWDGAASNISIASGGIISGLTTGVINSGHAVGTLTNDGTISGTSIGIMNTGSIASIVNDSGATIIGGNTGIFNSGGSIGLISNSGLIDPPVGIVNTNSGTIASIANNSGGVINGTLTGIVNSIGSSIGTITNSGTINGTANYGIFNANSTIGTIANNSTISGGVAGIDNNPGSIGTIINSINGTISGPFSGIYNANGGHIDLINNGGSIVSTSNAGIGNLNSTIGSIDNSGFINSSNNAAIGNDGGSIGAITNSGTIANPTGSGGIYNLGGGSISVITNTSIGTISSGDIGIDNANGSIGLITNDGTISGTSYAIANLDSSIGSIVNSSIGTISGSNAGIDSTGTIGSITNNGIISGVNYGIANFGGGIGLINNTGIGWISGGAAGILNNSGTIGSINNAGTVSGRTGIANTTSGPGSSIGAITNNGLISSSGAGQGIFNSAGFIGAIINSINGTISGGTTNAGIFNDGTIGTIANAGTISAGGTGIGNDGTIGTIINDGTISGTFGITNGGLIGTGPTAIDSHNGTIIGAISNNGTISGNILVNQDLTITGGLGTLTGGSISTNNHNLLFDSSASQMLDDNINVGASGTVTNSGVLQVNVAHSITGNFSQTSLNVLTFGVTDATHYGDLIISGNATLTNAQISIANLGSGLAGGENLTIVQAAGTADYSGTSLIGGAVGRGITEQLSSIVSGSFDDLVVAINSACQIVNSSTAIGALTPCVVWTGGDMSVAGGGTISGASTGVIVNSGSSVGTLTNSSTINGTHTGIYNTGSIAAISNSGTILGGSIGIANEGGSIGTITNANSIGGTSIGILNGTTVSHTIAGTIAAISNNGTITGGTLGIANEGGSIGTITNTGIISGGALFGILNGTGSGTVASTIAAIINNGFIGGTAGIFNTSSIGTVANTGMIGGIVSAIGTIAFISNSGTIASADAILNEDGGSIGVITNSIRASIAGNTTRGVGIDNNNATIGTISNNGAISGPTYGIWNEGLITSIVNNGVITASNTGILNFLATIGTITNSGTINGTNADGIFNRASIAAIVNETGGTISGAAAGLNNTGSIGVIANSGLIQSTEASMNAAGIFNSIGTIDTISNASTGTISGEFEGLFTENGSIGTIINSGLISGTIGLGEFVGAIGTIVNSIGGSISGEFGILGDAGTIAEIDNSGTISGGTGISIAAGIANASNSIGIITNSGLIDGPLNGIVNAGIIGTIGNSGIIQNSIGSGTSVAAINNGGAIATITNSGLISGGNIGILNNSIGSISTIANSGTISGGVAGIMNAGTIDTITNAGTISDSGIGAINNSGLITSISNSGLIRGTPTAISSTGTILGAISNSGTISGNINVLQPLTITGGIGTLTGGTIETNNHDLLFDSGAHQVLDDDVSVGTSNTFSLNGVMQVNNAHSITGNYLQTSAARLIIGVGSLSNNGDLIISGNATMTNSSISITPAGGAIQLGDSYTIVQDSTLGTADYSGITASARGLTGTVSSVTAGGFDNLVVSLASTGCVVVNSNTIIGNATCILWEAANMSVTGTVTGAPTAVINLGNVDGTLSNTGTLNGSGTGVYNAGSIAGIINSGSITGGNIGILNDSFGSIGFITNNSGGLIGGTAVVTGIRNNNGATIGTITNNGTIIGAALGILNEGSIASIVNASSITGDVAIANGTTGSIGTISNTINGAISGNMGIANGGAIDAIGNSGLISGSNYGLLNIGSIGSITNSIGGTITGTNIGINNATTSSGAFKGSIGAITNSGLISGGSIGINNSIGTIGTIANDAGGTIIGSIGIENESGTILALTNTGFIGGGNIGIGNTIGGSIGNITNFGDITGVEGAINNFASSIGTLANSGLISAGEFGIINNGTLGTIGTIGTIDNSGTILGLFGLVNGGFGTNESIAAIVNSGTIGGTNAGVLNFGGTIGSIVNTGTISGITACSLCAAVSNIGGTIGTLSNSGLIEGPVAIFSTAESSIAGTILSAISNTGTIEGNIGTDQDLTFTGGNASTIGTLTGYQGSVGTITANNLTFDNSAYQFLDDDVNVGSGSGVLTNNGTLVVDAVHSITGSYTQASSALLIVGVIDPTHYGDLIVSGDASMANNHVSIKPVSGSLSAGESFTIVQDVGTFNYSGVTATVTGFNASVSSINSGGFEDLIVSLLGSGGGGPLLIPPNQVVAELAANNLLMSQTVQAVGDHQSGVLTGGSTEVGKAAGSEYETGVFWADISGGYSSRASNPAVGGYTQGFYGMTFGIDDHIGEDTTVGEAISWNSGSAGGQGNLEGQQVGLNSFGFTTYGSERFGPAFVNEMAGIGIDLFSEKRDLTSQNEQASAKFQGTQYMARIDGGWDFTTNAGLPAYGTADGNSADGNDDDTARFLQPVTLTPLAGIEMVRTNINSYSESGAGADNLDVGGEGVNTLFTEIGGKVATTLPTAWGDLMPEIKVKWVHDFMNGAVTTPATLGGTSFTTETPRVARDGAEVAVAMTLKQGDNVSVRFEYNGDWRVGYMNNSGLIKVDWRY